MWARQPCSVLLVVALVAGLPAACGEPTAADAAWLHSPASLLQWADGSAAQVGRKHEHEYACLPACMHTGMHTGVHAYRHACRHAYTDAYIHTHPQRPAGVSVESMSMHKHAYMHACMHAYTDAYIHTRCAALRRAHPQRPADVSQMAASLLRPRSPWKRAHDHSALELATMWRDASILRNGTVVERHLHSAIRNTGRCEHAARLASTEPYPD